MTNNNVLNKYASYTEVIPDDGISIEIKDVQDKNFK